MLLIEGLIFLLFHDIVAFVLHLFALKHLATNLLGHANRWTCYITKQIIECSFQIPEIIRNCTLICYFHDG